MKEAAKRSLLNYCQVIDPTYQVEWFHEIIADVLEDAYQAVLEKRKKRVILAIPPRHGKSQLASVYFPSWVLGKRPRTNIILSSYSSDLAEKMGQKTRDVLNLEQYQAIFPGIRLRPDIKAKRKWETTHKGSYTGVGIGSSVTGIGGDIIILDDPHKDRAEAESATVRDTVYEYYRSTLYSRLEGAGVVIVIMQRWHVDDLVGRLLEENENAKEDGTHFDEWEVINFPAIAEDDEYYQGEKVRKAGESLWPEKFPLEVLNGIRATQGVYNWNSQYMQDPILAETQEFKDYFFRYYNLKDILKDKQLRYTTTVDPAIGQREENDNTVILTVAKELDGPNIYRIREDAGHFTPKQTVDIVFKHQSEYNSDVYLETVAYQKALRFAIDEEQRKREQYFTIKEISSRTKKEERIRGLLPLYEAGVVWHRQGFDVQYEKEALQFPRGKRDDRLDAMAMQLEAMKSTRSHRKARHFRRRYTGYGKVDKRQEIDTNALMEEIFRGNRK